MQHMNRGHGRVREVEIEKLVDARGMTGDGPSSPITVLSSHPLLRLSSGLSCLASASIPHFRILRKSHFNVQNNGNRTHRTANLVNKHPSSACTASLAFLAPAVTSAALGGLLSFYFLYPFSLELFFFRVVPSNACLPWRYPTHLVCTISFSPVV